MSEHENEPRFDRPKIKLTRNAKGDSQWEVSVIPGFTGLEMDELRNEAVRQYKALENDLLGLNRD